MKAYVTYHNQIQGLKEVATTVKTVEKIAAASVHRLKEKVVSLDEYAGNIERLLARLSLFYHPKNHSLMKQNRTGNKALVIITGNKSLVGGLWHAVITAYLRKAYDYQSVMVAGGKGRLFLEEEQREVIRAWDGWANIPGQEDTNIITNYILDEFKRERLAKVDILYPQFVSLAEQKPAIISFLPFTFSREQARQEKLTNDVSGLPIFEPTKQKIFDQLLQKYIGVYLYKVVLEAKLSELSARTVAMEHANIQTRDVIQKLNHSFTKERHRTMTQRQLESFAAHKI